MLNREIKSFVPTEVSHSSPQEVELGLRDLFGFLRRRKGSIGLTAAVFLLLAVAYLFFAPPEYSATASLVIDQRKVDIFGSGAVSAESSIANASMETEIQMITSNRVAEVAVNNLGLLRDQAFMQGPPGFIDAVVATISPLLAPPAESTAPETTASVSAETAAEPLSTETAAEPASSDAEPASSEAETPPGEANQAEAMRRATSIIRGYSLVRRAGLSYAINITYIAPDPEQAARIANGLAQAYLDEKTNRQVNSAKRLSEWLDTRIAELRVLAFGSELRAEEKSAIRATYDAFIQRYTQAVQQQSVPETDALVITAATPPRNPSSPNAPLIVVGALMLGTIIGSGVALGRELLDRRIRTRRQLATVTQSPCLGLLPKFRLKRSERRAIAKRSRTPSSDAERMFDAGPWLSLSLRSPYSQFTETLRSLRLAADSGRVRVLGVASAMPGEGKTSVAGNLARLTAMTRSVLLIDADIRDPALSRYLASQEAPGLVEVAMGQAQLADVVWADRETPLRFLPAGGEHRYLGSGEILGSTGMKALLDQAREKFDFVVVDLPPLLPVVDARAIAPLVDGFAFVAEWGDTTEDVVSQAILNGDIEGKIVGSILNKVVMSRYRRFDPQAPSRESNAYLESDRRVT